MDSKSTEFDNYIMLESAAINSALIFADYANNPEIFHYEFELIGKNVKSKHCTNNEDGVKNYNTWYLKINNNEGPASSYSLSISLHFDSKHSYHIIEIICGIKTSFSKNEQLENLMLLGFPRNTNGEECIFHWGIPSLWLLENSEADKRVSFHNRIVSKVKPVEKIIEVTENFATVLAGSLLNTNNYISKNMSRLSITEQNAQRIGVFDFNQEYKSFDWIIADINTNICYAAGDSGSLMRPSIKNYGRSAIEYVRRNGKWIQEQN